MCVDDDDENAISKKPPLLIAQDTQWYTERPTQIRGCVLVPRTQIHVKSAREKNHMRIEVFVSFGVSRTRKCLTLTLVQTVEFVNKILWCDHSKNETSGLKVFLNGTICFQYFTIYESNLEILLNFDSLITWKRQGEKQNNCILFYLFILFICFLVTHIT